MLKTDAQAIILSVAGTAVVASAAGIMEAMAIITIIAAPQETLTQR
jgi:hypothetical protein